MIRLRFSPSMFLCTVVIAMLFAIVICLHGLASAVGAAGVVERHNNRTTRIMSELREGSTFSNPRANENYETGLRR